MLYLLFTLLYLFDIIILILLIILVFNISNILKSFGENYTLWEKIKIAPELLIDKPSSSFHKFSKQSSSGTFESSYNKNRQINKSLKHTAAFTLGCLTFKLILIGLIFFNIPRPGIAEFQNSLHIDNNYNDFNKGTYNLSQWNGNAITNKAGQLHSNYISAPIGLGDKVNNWYSLSWEQDNDYNQAPPQDEKTTVLFEFDSLDNCSQEQTYTCEMSDVKLTKGIYNSSAYKFNNNSKIKLNENLNFNGPFTISAWIKPNIDIYNGSEEQDYIIITKAFGDYMASNPYLLKYSYLFGIIDGNLNFTYWPNQIETEWVKAQVPDYSFTANTWYHLAMTYNTSNEIKFYINGFKYDSTTQDYDDGDINHAFNTNFDSPTWLGCVGYRWFEDEEIILNEFEGAIDELSIINEELSMLEIRDFVTQANAISFQIRTGNTIPLTNRFIGPDNTSSTYFTNNIDNQLDFLPPSKYMQYVVYFKRHNTFFKPKLYSTTVEYSSLEDKKNRDIEIATATPTKTNNNANLEQKEKAIEMFKELFNKNPKTQNDWQFISITAENKISHRALEKEKIALNSYINKMRKLPETDIEWGLIKALAYTELGQEIINQWNN